MLEVDGQHERISRDCVVEAPAPPEYIIEPPDSGDACEDVPLGEESTKDAGHLSPTVVASPHEKKRTDGDAKDASEQATVKQ